MSVSFKNILVPVDFSEMSDRAMSVVLETFQGFDKITVIAVYEGSQNSVLDYENEVDTMLKRNATDELQRFQEKYARNNVSMDTIVAKGNPANEIISAAKNLQVDTIVMGSKGKNPVVSVFFGSTTYQVARKANCSVLVIR